MALKFQKKLLLAKKEVTYGTDPVPDGTANAIKTSNLTISPLEAETAAQNQDQPSLGGELLTHFGVHVVIEFDVHVVGGGAADIPPHYAPLLLACGMAETVNAGTDVQYDPVSANEDSATLYTFIDGQRHTAIGCRGSWGLRMVRGYPLLHFRFVGLWVAPTSTANPTPTFTTVSPVVMSNANTTFSLHSLTPNFFTGEVNQNNEVVYQDIVGDESVQIVDRAPAGSLTIEAPAISVKDWFTTVKANTLGALQIVHGTVAGNIFQLDVDKDQLMRPRYAENNGVATIQFDQNIIPTSGDDDYKITTS